MNRPKFVPVKMRYRTHGTHPCNMTFPDTCAVRMSEALVAADPKLLDVFRKSGKNTCPHGYIRGAQDLAAVLLDNWGVQDYNWIAPGAAPDTIAGVCGVVCYMNIPGFSGQGHIDLWDGKGAIGSAYWNASPIWMWKLP